MAKTNFNDFISVMVKGDWREDTEDRLTQIFAACFNNSSLIRQSTFEYFGLRSGRKQWVKAYIRTQVPNGSDSRPDMEIQNGKKLLAIIESKKDAVLDSQQLKRHEKHKGRCAHHIALTFDYYEVKKPWKARLWYELFLTIEKNSKGLDIDKTDDFICSSFIKYCKGKNYMRPTEISCDEVNGAAKFLSGVRSNTEVKSCHMHGIDDLSKINSFINLAFEKLKENYNLIEKAGAAIASQKDEKGSPLYCVGKKFSISKRNNRYIGIYFVPEEEPRIIVQSINNDCVVLEASWISTSRGKKTKFFLKYINRQGVMNKKVKLIEINSFCEVVGQIIKKNKG